MKEPENAHFEAVIEKLQTLIEEIESDDQSIEKSLQAYEEGIGLIRKAQRYLAEAEQKVHLLTQDQDGTEDDAGE